MGYEVVLVCVFLCSLQFHCGNGDCYNIQLRIPPSSINGDLQNTQLNSNVPYPSQGGYNICNSCRGSICNNNCRSNYPFRFNSLPNTLTVSVPSKKSRTGRIDITIDTVQRAPGNEAAPATPTPTPTPTGNGEISNQTVQVVVRFIPKDQIKGNLSTSIFGNSSATSTKNGDIMRANTEGIIVIPNYDKVLDISVIVNNKKLGGRRLSQSTLDTHLITYVGEKKVSETVTKAGIKKTLKYKNTKPNYSNQNPNEPLDTSDHQPAATLDSNDSHITGSDTDPATPDAKQPGASAPQPPTPPAPTGDSEPPAPIKAEPVPPPASGDPPSATASTAAGSIAGDNTAGSATGAVADSG